MAITERGILEPCTDPAFIDGRTYRGTAENGGDCFLLAVVSDGDDGGVCTLSSRGNQDSHQNSLPGCNRAGEPNHWAGGCKDRTDLYSKSTASARTVNVLPTNFASEAEQMEQLVLNQANEMTVEALDALPECDSQNTTSEEALRGRITAQRMDKAWLDAT